MLKFFKAFGLLCFLLGAKAEDDAFQPFLSSGPVLYTKESSNSRQGYFSLGQGSLLSEIEAAELEIKALFQSSLTSHKSNTFKLYSELILDLVKKDQTGSRQVFNVTEEEVLAKRLYQKSPNSEGVWLTSIEAQFYRLTTKNKLIDITDRQNSVHPLSKKKAPKIPQTPKFHDFAVPFLDTLDADEMKAFLTKFSSFYNRYYNSNYGVKSAQFLFDSIQKVISDSQRNDISVKYFPHSWKQSSIIVRFEGKNKKTDEIVVVGAHQDSVSQWNPWFGRAPGADDDGSGTTSTIKAFQALAKGGFLPNRTLEFHWYSGEEGGLKGSEAIASKYSSQGKNVIAMMHFDMSGHFTGTERIAVVQDHTDPKLSEFLRKLIIAYTDLKWVNSRCGYGCSDHASWDAHGFRAAFPIEDPDIESNPNIHTSRDTVDTLNFHHTKQFSRLAVAFAIELSA